MAKAIKLKPEMWWGAAVEIRGRWTLAYGPNLRPILFNTRKQVMEKIMEWKLNGMLWYRPVRVVIQQAR